MLWNLTATSHVNRSLFASQSSEKGELHFPLGFIIVQTLIFSLLFPWTSISLVLVSKMWPSASWSFWCLCGFGSGFFFGGGKRVGSGAFYLLLVCFCGFFFFCSLFHYQTSVLTPANSADQNYNFIIPNVIYHYSFTVKRKTKGSWRGRERDLAVQRLSWGGAARKEKKLREDYFPEVCSLKKKTDTYIYIHIYI